MVTSIQLEHVRLRDELNFRTSEQILGRHLFQGVENLTLLTIHAMEAKMGVESLRSMF
jgi:hypothetical protein